MGLIESSFVPDSVFVSPAEWDAENAVVWLRGEHDLSTVAALSAALSKVIALDDADLILDLSEVLFMDASTIGVIIGTQQILRRRSRTLMVRSPSRWARHLLDLCDLGDLIGPPSSDVAPVPGSAAALESWVAVPKASRVDRGAEVSPSEPIATPDSVPVGLVLAKEMVA